jgi:hypothetical protein
MRVLCVLSFALLALAACGAGSHGRNFDPDSAAADRGWSYTGAFPDATVGEGTIHCPNAFPTGGATESDHEGVGPFFCNY